MSSCAVGSDIRDPFQGLKRRIADVCKKHGIEKLSIDIDAETYSLNGHRTIVNSIEPELDMDKLTDFISDIGSDVQVFLDDFPVLNPYLVIQKDTIDIMVVRKI